ncbi:putative branched-chain-amino-acid aminotransferase [Calycina marina]|uniref:Branched-chain-amino-acid aminotransferase n=1 Tax=Calycina marina TaxID=1763456 RepID=A0A9P8CH63_9HELO|nr:putative branched-chain-amino-acid aminotransferase [Calycina marina]
MAPSAITAATTPPHGIKTAALTASAVYHQIEAQSGLRPLDASKLIFTPTTTPMSVPAKGDAEAYISSQCSDHMITAVWKRETGWESPELKPYGNLSLAPTASVLHYATECFEGMKVYRGYDKKLRLFRPEANCARMLISATRIALPAFEPSELEKLILALLEVDGVKWLPKTGDFLYLRPTMIGSAPGLGVATPREATLFVIMTFMPSLNKEGGLRLLASQNGVRAWPGGFGFAKVGANYGPSLMATGEARARGYDQVLWLLNGQVTEAGASNFFIVWKTKAGNMQLVTAPLGNKIILDGITRRSIIQLAKERLSDELELVERDFTMDDIVEAVNEGRIVEAFAAGTAYFVAPISAINYNDQDLDMPMYEGDSGKYTAILKTWLMNIMYGKENHPWGVVVKEKQ